MPPPKINLTAFTFLLLSLVSASIAGPNYNLPLNRPYTLKNSAPFVLEAEYHRLIESGKKRQYQYPRPCQLSLDSSNLCYENTRLHFSEGDAAHLNIKLNSGLEYRYQNENVEAFDLGLSTYGFKGPLSFYLDAGMFTELHEDFTHPSYDREFIERQTEDNSGSIAYTSYSRYRGNVNLTTKFGNVTAARDALHWGPGLYNNLSFHQNAIPFHYLAYSSGIGPLQFTTVYGKLGIATNKLFFPSSKDDRHLYAHRYEWSVTNNFMFGVSEQLIFYESNDPFAFIPIVPLYITKGNQVERSNNGNISFDVSYRLLKSWHVYSEFLIDDLQSPTALFDDFWGNKWGAMGGVHKAFSLPSAKMGAVLEVARIEPWVYTHYRADEAQAANLNYPLGNPYGPNSQNLTTKLYLRNNSGLYLSGTLHMLWKGTDNGSHINDVISSEERAEPKQFIYGIGKPEVIFTPYINYQFKGLTMSSSMDFGENTTFQSRLFFQY